MTDIQKTEKAFNMSVNRLKKAYMANYPPVIIENEFNILRKRFEQLRKLYLKENRTGYINN